jgi:hypothetical protein
LLVVEAYRRHVREPDSLQSTDVYPRLHRCGHAEQVDARCISNLVLHEHILESPLAYKARAAIGLARQLLGIYSEWWFSDAGEVLVVVRWFANNPSGPYGW